MLKRVQACGGVSEAVARLRRRVPGVSGLCAVLWLAVAVAASQELDVDQLRWALYDVDSRLPLNATVRAAPPLKNEAPALTKLRVRYLVTYDSMGDQRVPGILAVPRNRSGRMPAVLLLAGSGGHKDTDYVRIASDMLNTMGCIAFSIDTQYHGDRARKGRSGDIHFVHEVVNRDAWIQTVRDLRRAVDYLSSRPDVDARRIGFLGFSQGGMIGGTFLGVEPRLKAACLVVPGGGFVEWATQKQLVPENRRRDLIVGAALTDPVHFIGRFAPRPLLILAAKRDELIPETATQALVQAAGEGKEVRWYESGHVLPPTALLVDARRFLERHLLDKAGGGDAAGSGSEKRAAGRSARPPARLR